MTENIVTREGEVVVVNEVVETITPMSEERIAEKMRTYRERHPEEFSGTPEWQIKVTAESASRIYDETGILFWPL